MSQKQQRYTSGRVKTHFVKAVFFWDPFRVSLVHNSCSQATTTQPKLAQTAKSLFSMSRRSYFRCTGLAARVCFEFRGTKSNEINACNIILIGGLEHFLFSHILGTIIPIDFHIFQRGRYATNQYMFVPRHQNHQAHPTNSSSTISTAKIRWMRD